MPRKTGHPNCRQAVIVIVVAQIRHDRIDRLFRITQISFSSNALAVDVLGQLDCLRYKKSML